MLAQNGYIHKVKGKGSFVLERDRYNFPVSGLVSYKEMSERIILDIDFLLASIVPHLSMEITGQSIYEYLENELNLKISYAKKVISVEPATSMDHQNMDIGQDTHVVVRGYVHLEDTTLFQYTESRHRLDKFQFVDFVRRESTLSF